MTLSVGSAFSGIEGFGLGFELAGMTVAWQAETDPEASKLLAHHWPEVPNLGDVTQIMVDPPGRDRPRRGVEDAGPGRRGTGAQEGRGPRDPGGGSAHARSGGGGGDHPDDIPNGAHSGERDERLPVGRAGPRVGRPASLRVDVLCGGFPCQDISVAGRRKGLGGARSGLFFEFARIAAALRPRWVVIENVPGLLTSGRAPQDPERVVSGLDLAVILGTLADVGYEDVSWRVVDALNLGVPQRRRRLLVVGRLGAGTGSRQVLLESEGEPWRAPQGEAAGPGAAAALTGGSASGRGVSVPGRQQEDDHNLIARGVALRGRDGGATAELGDETAFALRASQGGGDKPHAVIASRGDVTHRHEFVGALTSTEGMERPDAAHAQAGWLVAAALTASAGHHGHSSPRGDGADNIVAVPYRKAQRAHDPADCERWEQADRADTLTGHSATSGHAVVSPDESWALDADGRDAIHAVEHTMPVTASHGQPGTVLPRTAARVRRLTPTECERLQGFPDSWTAPGPDGDDDLGPGVYVRRYAGRIKPNRHARRRGVDAMRMQARARRAIQFAGWRHVSGMSDSARYRMLGNAVAVPLAEWLGSRIVAYEAGELESGGVA